MSRTRSMPLSSDISTRLTRGTGASRAPSRLPDEGVGGGEIGRGVRARRQPLERVGDARQARRVVGGLRRCASDLRADFDFDLAIDWPWHAFGVPLLLAGRRCAPQAGDAGNGQKLAGFRRGRGVAIGAAAAIVRANFGAHAGPAGAAGARPKPTRGSSMFITPAFAQGSLRLVRRRAAAC